MKKIICTILILLIILPIIPAYANYSPQFEYEAQTLYDMGLFKGTDVGFELDKKCNRVQAAVLFIRIVGKESEALNNTKSHPFTDVPEWANAYIGQMYYEGYTKGISESKYGIGDLTANQFAAFCLRALGYSEQASDWRQFNYNSAFDKMYELNIIKQNEYDSIKSSSVFYRDYAVKLIYNSLFESGRDKQNNILLNKLVNEGAISNKYAPEVIELSSSEDIYALSRILATDYAKNNYYTKNSSLSLEKDMSRFEIPAELSTDAEKIEYFQTASYKLANDVDVVLTREYGSSSWDPEAFTGIGSNAHPFKGNFDGNNKTITLSSNKDLETRNMVVNYIGFFSETDDAKIFDTNIAVSSDITATSSYTANNKFSMGGLVGFATKSNISNCSITFENANFGLKYSGELFEDLACIGGLVGNSSFTIYNNCSVNLEDSKIYVSANKVTQAAQFGGASVGGLLGFSGAGSNNTSNLGKLGNQLYHCTVVSNNSTQQDVIAASIEGGTECAVGGVVGCSFNNLLAKHCTVNITKGNITATQSESTASSTLGTAVGGIIGRMEHTGQLIKCDVTGDYLNITSSGPDNRHLVGGIAGNAYGPVHRDVTPLLNCHFDGTGTSTISTYVDTTNLKTDSHPVGVGGIAGLAAYQIYDCTVKDVLIINHSEGMAYDSFAGEIVGVWQAEVNPNGNFTAGPIEVGRCTSSGVTFDISDNVRKNNL